MSIAFQGSVIEKHIEQATAALRSARYFEAEREAAKALNLAHDQCDFQRMERIIDHLAEARYRRLELALNVGTITIVDTLPEEEFAFEAGCYLVQPPLVGAHARRLRVAALDSEIPVAALCREPLTMLGLCPIVAIAGSATIRTKIDPPPDPDNPDLDWFIEALGLLGDSAIENLDPKATAVRRIEALLSRIDALPEHEGLHRCLQDACREAADARSDNDELAAKPDSRS